MSLTTVSLAKYVTSDTNTLASESLRSAPSFSLRPYRQLVFPKDRIRIVHVYHTVLYQHKVTNKSHSFYIQENFSELCQI